MRRQTADRRRVGPAVIVDDDDKWPPVRPCLRSTGDIVQRFPGHAAGERAVADYRYGSAVVISTHREGLGHAIGPGPRRRCVRALHPVMFALGTAGVSGQPTLGLDGVELVSSPGHEFVHVGLMARVEDHRVARRLEYPVDCQRQFDDTEVRSEVAAVACGRGDEQLTDLRRQRIELISREVAKITRFSYLVENSHVRPLRAAVTDRSILVHTPWDVRTWADARASALPE